MAQSSISLLLKSSFTMSLFLFTFAACPGGGEQPYPVEECSEVMCNLYCENGFEVGDDGCEICSCNEEPVDPIEQKCDSYGEDSCPEGQHCEALPTLLRPDEEQAPIAPAPEGICVDDVEPSNECYSSQDCSEQDICTVELGECNSPEPTCFETEDGDTICASDAVCVGQCIPREIKPRECEELSPRHCEDNPECELIATPDSCDCPYDEQDGEQDTSCGCTFNEPVCVPKHVEPEPRNECYSSDNCDENMVCTTELGECNSPEPDCFTDQNGEERCYVTDVCVGQCIPRDMPQKCEETPIRRCEENPECEINTIQAQCDCPPDSDFCACPEIVELICVTKPHQPEPEEDLCSTQTPCSAGLQCDFQVCTEDERGEMGECFGYCTADEPEFCIEVEQAAVSPNGYCVVFPTPCEVPEDWRNVEQCE